MSKKFIDPITWDIEIPLVSNRYMLGSMLKVTLGAGMLVGTLVAFLLAVQGAWKLIPTMVGILFAGGVGFFLLSVLIALVVYGNALRVRFTVSEDGIRHETIDRVAKVANRGTMIVGLITGRPGAIGTGLLSTSNQNQVLNWSGAFVAKPDPTRRSLAMRNSWRTLMTVYCTAENYDAVRNVVTNQMRLHQTAQRCVGKSVVRSYLLRTVLVISACLPFFLLGDVYGYGLLLPLMLMCFALATVWFVRFLAWVVLCCSTLLVINILTGAAEVRQSIFRPGESYLRYEVLSGDDWALTAWAALGLIYLLWLARETLKARVLPALESDLKDSFG